jgi:hypothetical protein
MPSLSASKVSASNCSASSEAAPGALANCCRWRARSVPGSGNGWTSTPACPDYRAAPGKSSCRRWPTFEQLGGVSFHKGCYPGQEIIARTQYLGKVKRHLYRAHSSSPIAARQAIYSPANPEHPCGMIVNAAAGADRRLRCPGDCPGELRRRRRSGNCHPGRRAHRLAAACALSGDRRARHCQQCA